MILLTFDELWERLRNSDESVLIEAKRAEDVGNSIMETVSAFSNEPERGGGYFLFGVALKPDTLFPDYEIVGVPNPDRLQQELASKCNSMLNVLVRPQITVERRGGKTALVMYVPEAQSQDKPVYIKSKGMEKGAFRRIGSADLHCTDEDLALFYQLRTHRSFDAEAVSDTTLDDFDSKAISTYRRLRAELDVNAEELAFSDAELLQSLYAATTHQGQVCATIAGLMLFGKRAALRRHYPSCRVDYIMVPGREWVEDPDERYHSVEWLEPLMTLIPRVIAHVMEDIPKAFAMSEDGVQRREIPRIPQKVVREAIVNALMHRSYRMKQPVQIIRYSNRIEIRNPGHSLKPDDRLGEPGSLLRNEKIAATLHDTPYAETKGTGIRTMRRLMAEANLSAPFLESDYVEDKFLTILLPHHLLNEGDVRWLAQFADLRLTDDEARTMVALREVGAMSNAYYRTLNGVDTLTASRRLQHLRDMKLLEQKGRGTATHYVPGERFTASLPNLVSSSLASVNLPVESSSTGKPLPVESSSTGNGLPVELPQLPVKFPELPEVLQFAVRQIGKRSTPQDVRTVIRLLCEWRELRLAELAAILSRNPRWIQESYLRPMLKDRELEFTYEDPQHPLQAYRARPKDETASQN